MTFDAFFLDGPEPGGRRFCVWHPPAGATRGAVLHVHAFAEEMNKSRRMAALQARALAARGFGVLQIDRLGCGDSSGDFADATWAAWTHDVVSGAAWLRRRAGGPLWLWGVRAGCLLADAAARRIDGTVNLLFWQPATSGKVALQQFLRLKAASEMLDGDAKGVMNALRGRLAAGAAVEIAGYMLPAALAEALELATLRPPPNAERAVWLEVSSRADATLSPASTTAVARWQEAGVAVQAAVVAGPAFWQSTEIEVAPALIDAGCDALAEVLTV